ncbi:hypothetical protein JCGZ_20147 [Jatropha curcas]|uniref:Uncharacterized protein n=1 Tax=Jatropha curcas TaxID=180498 RepID=A0A067JUD6_JATCU|nr:hypothetical protein JCGZ_20147 [Jatropha curcas]
MIEKTHSVVEKETVAESLDSDGGPTGVGLGSPEKGTSPHEEGEINSLAQNPQKLHLPLTISINAQVKAMLKEQRQMMAQLLQTMNVFMEVTGKKTDAMDSPINQSPTSKSSAKEGNESSSKCAKELGMQLPQNPSRGTDSGRALAEERYQPPHWRDEPVHHPSKAPL